MGNLSKNFSRIEFACKCGCGFDTVDTETLDVLQECADYFSEKAGKQVAVHVTSGCRCREYNAQVGGTKSSQHIRGRAVDFVIQNVDPQLVYDYLDAMYADRYGLGDYDNFTHLDTRTHGPTRW